MNLNEYTSMNLSNLPTYFIKQYKLTTKTTKDGYFYIKICKGMCGLPQAGILPQTLLEQKLNEKGYRKSILTPGFWENDWRKISSNLFVDDFGMKYVGK